MERVNLSAKELRDDPYPVYARLRREAAVVPVRMPLNGDGVALARYDDVVAALKDERLVNDPVNAPGAPSPLDAPLLPPMLQAFFRSMLFKDPPDHRRLRDLVQKAFTPRRVEELHDRVERITHDLLDAAVKKGNVDLIADFALPLPLAVISEMLGIPEDDRVAFRRRMAGLLDSNLDLWTLLKNIPNGILAKRFFDRLVEQRRAAPGTDLVSALVQVEQAGDRLTHDELMSMIFLLLLAGHETTVNLIGNGVLALLQHPEQFAKLRAQPELVGSAVEELLRYGNPVVQGTPRYAREDLELHGERIRKGTYVLPLVASANRDERVFERPDELDITRSPNRHIAFGYGIHFCLGAPLARMEGKIALAALVQRFPGLRLAVPAEKLQWGGFVASRGLRALPLHLA